MRAHLEAAASGHNIYAARQQKYDTGQQIPFRVSPTPFRLDDHQTAEVTRIGTDIAAYFQAVDSLYRTDDTVRTLLDTGKPEIFLGDTQTDYLFVRPDLIITQPGFSICEVETSPFGLALAEILNRGYRQAGHETLVADQTMSEQTPLRQVLFCIALKLHHTKDR